MGTAQPARSLCSLGASLPWRGGNGDSADGALRSPRRLQRRGDADGALTRFPRSGGPRDAAAMGTTRKARSLRSGGSGDGNGADGAVPRSLNGATWTAQPTRFPRSGNSGDAAATGMARMACSLRSGSSGNAAVTGAAAEGATGTARTAQSPRSGGAAATGTARSLRSLGVICDKISLF